MGVSKAFVTIPTYTERENILPLVKEIQRLPEETEIVVADDDSPDGIWQVVLELAQQDPRIHLLRRTQDKGRGRAGVEAFRYALAHGAQVLIEMDGDLSHHPRHIPSLLQEIRNYDLVIGAFLFSRGELHRLQEMPWGWGTVRFGLVALPWYAAIAWRNSDFLPYFLSPDQSVSIRQRAIAPVGFAAATP
ncbi:MAG: glycosyltransferase [Candidatus Tectomicrobia bacterium]|uniref:Glycosyltransferase n=1 Tax=Tectimicrobiota bacterium TaxID=2528274 RepID=A0A932CNU4_UNCTE|nr:glycosyltransferase [Candidatus Tectomicrobia bacterium]